jgi:hypothetical protein
MRNRKMTTALLTALTATAIAAPGASARPIDSVLPAAAASAQPAGVNAGFGPQGPAPGTTQQAPTATASPSSDGFNWGDAGIGAAGMLTMLGLGAGAASGLRRSRTSHPAVS